MQLWQAHTTFGNNQVDEVLRDPTWRSQFPQFYENLDSRDAQVGYAAVIPIAMIQAMASQLPWLYAFGEQNGVLKCRQNMTELPSGFQYLSPPEALERFGPERLFEAVDYGTSMPVS